MKIFIKNLKARFISHIYVGALFIFFFPGFISCQTQLPYLIRDEIKPVNAPFEIEQFKRPVFPDNYFDIRDFGAKEGGEVKCTEAIQRAIVHAANNGGGYVIIPKGKWLTGAIHLDNNISLYLDKDAELVFSQDPKDYLPVVFSRHEDVECYKYSAFIYANNKTNIAITGAGTLNGQGKTWWDYKTKKKESEVLLYEMGKNNVPVEKRIFDGTDGRELRPAFFQPMNCTNVLVEGVTFLFGAFWTITPTYCDNVIIRKVKIITYGDLGDTPNGDGVNPSSSKNVLIEDCEFSTGDDCIAIKAGRDNDGLRVNKPCENIIIRNCKGLIGHGGIVIGSETSGGIRNIFAENCQFYGTDRVVRIKTTRGRGGIIENMWFKNLSGDSIQKEALRINMRYNPQGPLVERLPAQPVTKSTPIIRNINFENIKITNSKNYSIELLGLPEMLMENISFKDIYLSSTKGINLSDVNNISFKNIFISSKELPVVEILDGKNIEFEKIEFAGKSKNLFNIKGKNSQNIVLKKSNIGDKNEAFSFGEEASHKSIIIED
ncbi:MAG: Polygalacturonase [Ignavibacteriae bacterium]|nr:MAG: Polygalacturonase [Ignavibacteriota bacterium]